MPRTIVRIQDSVNANEPPSFSLELPYRPGGGRTCPLESNPTQTPFLEMSQGDGSPEWVRQAGAKLYADIVRHPVMGPALNDILLQQLGGYHPLCFLMDSVLTADRLPWEAFQAGTGQFLALDARWPIVRVREVREAVPILVYDFTPPLRMVAVLSVTGETALTRADAMPQWLRLSKAIQTHRRSLGALPVEVTVLTCDENVRAAVVNAALEGVTAGLIQDKDSLLEDIARARPNILHFFCHGTADDAPHLSIGTRIDWEAAQTPGIALEAMELRQYGEIYKTVWLVTLNCCESATQARDARSLADSLVSVGFPAALGMRESIDVETAHLLCEFFFPAVLHTIGAVPPGETREIEWAEALYQARRALVASASPGQVPQTAARSSKLWTIPALYMRKDPFSLKRVDAAPGGISARRQYLLDYIRTLQQQKLKASEDYKDLPPDVLTLILGDFDGKLNETLRELKITP